MGAEIIASTILAGFLVMIIIVFIYRKAPCRISKARIFGCHGVAGNSGGPWVKALSV